MTVKGKEFQLLQRFTAIIYSNKSNSGYVNASRRELFSQNNRTMENIPRNKKPFYSIHFVQFIKLEFGQPVISMNRSLQLLRTVCCISGVQRALVILCDQTCLLHPGLAVSWPSVLAKVLHVQNHAHARKHTEMYRTVQLPM